MKHGPTSSKLLLLCLKVQSTGFSSDSNFFFLGGGGDVINFLHMRKISLRSRETCLRWYPK